MDECIDILYSYSSVAPDNNLMNLDKLDGAGLSFMNHRRGQEKAINGNIGNLHNKSVSLETLIFIIYTADCCLER